MQKINKHTYTHLMLFLADVHNFIGHYYCINYIGFFSHTTHITRHFPICCEISAKKCILSSIKLQSKESCILFWCHSIEWYGIAIIRGNMTHRFKTAAVFSLNNFAYETHTEYFKLSTVFTWQICLFQSILFYWYVRKFVYEPVQFMRSAIHSQNVLYALHKCGRWNIWHFIGADHWEMLALVCIHF